MTEFDAVYFDGRTSARKSVRVLGSSDSVHIVGDGVDLVIPLSMIMVDPPIPGARRALNLPGGAQLQTDAHVAIETLFPRTNRMQGWIYRLEQRWRFAFAGIAVAAAFAAWCVAYGLPVAATIVAELVPPGIEIRLGERTLSTIDNGLCMQSALDADRQRVLLQSFAMLTSGQGAGYRLALRNCAGVGANAFALPGGIVVLTDDLVKLAQNDHQVLAVLAHEVGHVRGRHGLRTALQGAGLAALLSALAGDAVSITNLAVTLPMLLLQNGYSRAFEDEADEYAIRRLGETGISPKSLAEILARLEAQRNKAGAPPDGESRSTGADRRSDYFSTHPATAKRIERALSNQ